MKKRSYFFVFIILAVFAVSCSDGFAKNGGYTFTRHLTEVKRPCSINTIFQVTNTFNLPVPGLELRDLSVKENWDDVNRETSGMTLKTKTDIEYAMKIVLVIDNSRSYSEKKWLGMKDEIKTYIDGMFKEQQIAIISYGLTSQLISPFKSSDDADKEALKATIDALEMVALDAPEVVAYIAGGSITAEDAAGRNNLRAAMRAASALYNDIYSTSRVEQGFIFLFTDGGHGAYEQKMFYDARIADGQIPVSANNDTLTSKVLSTLRWNVPDDIDWRNVVVFNMEASPSETELLTGIASRWYEYCAGSGFLGLRLGYHAKLLERHSRALYLLSYNTDRRFDATKAQNTYKLTIRLKGNGHLLGNYKLLYDFDTQDIFDPPSNEVYISGITGDKMGFDFVCNDFPKTFDSLVAPNFVGKEYKRHLNLLIHPNGVRTVYLDTPGKGASSYEVTSTDPTVVTVAEVGGSNWSAFTVTPSATANEGDICKINIKDSLNPEFTREIPVTVVEIAGNFIEVQTGSFQIGSLGADAQEDEYGQARIDDIEDENNGKRVGTKFLPTVNIDRPYYICDLEVTQKLWFEVMLSRPAAFKDDSTESNYIASMNRPVENISWNDAVDFCNKLSRIAGLQEVYTGTRRFVNADFSKNGYRLPTEAEWEYAARGAQAGVLDPNTRNNYAGTDLIGLPGYSWYKINSMDSTQKGGEKTANELGLYDMSGNVWEWCWDWYFRDQYFTYKDDVSDPAGPTELLSENFKDDLGDGNGKRDFNANEDRRVIRGGSIFYSEDKITVSNRNSGTVASKNQGTGLRLVRTK